MDFLVLTPGVHSVDVLTLTDVETGYAVNLRFVVLHFGILRGLMWTSYQICRGYCGTRAPGVMKFRCDILQRKHATTARRVGVESRKQREKRTTNLGY